MVPSSIKAAIYDAGLSVSDIAREADVSRKYAGQAIAKWHGKVGNPRGKARAVLKIVEKYTGKAVYKELSDQ